MKELVGASKYPLSLILVGIGENKNFDKLETLDSDSELL